MFMYIYLHNFVTKPSNNESQCAYDQTKTRKHTCENQHSISAPVMAPVATSRATKTIEIKAFTAVKTAVSSCDIDIILYH